MDKAASLHYASIKDKNGEWISCECVFTVVHDVLVACTSIYKRNQNSIGDYFPPTYIRQY